MHSFITAILAPHYCCSCGRIGSILCESCKYNIVDEPYEACILCQRVAPGGTNLCGSCKVPYNRAWAVTSRKGATKELINKYKFERAQAAYSTLTDLLDKILPALPPDICIVPVPTITSHIRERGYDHMALIGKELATRRGLTYAPLLKRATKTVQHGSNRATRLQQAKQAFRVSGRCDGKRILLVDDVCTTGATLEHAALALRNAGSTEVWVAIITVQLLEK